MNYRDKAEPHLDSEKWRGPHQGKELQLMLAGVKPMAFVDGPYVEEFKKAAKEHGWVMRKATAMGQVNGNLYCALPTEVWRLEKMDEIYAAARERGHMTRRDHAAIGLLLGYSKEAIRRFLQEPRLAKAA